MKQSGERHVSTAPQTGLLIEGQRTLEDLKVLQVCVFGIDIKLHPGHWYIEVDTVEDLAESRAVGRLSVFAIEGYGGEARLGRGANLPSTALFDLGDI